jgi:putative membrane protein
LLGEKNESEDNMFGGGMMGGFGGAMGGLGLFGGLLSALLTIGLLVGLVFFAIWLWRRYGEGVGTGFGSGSRLQHVEQPSAREILEARYARGELTREEFRTMVHDLGGS